MLQKLKFLRIHTLLIILSSAIAALTSLGLIYLLSQTINNFNVHEILKINKDNNLFIISFFRFILIFTFAVILTYCKQLYKKDHTIKKEDKIQFVFFLCMFANMYTQLKSFYLYDFITLGVSVIFIGIAVTFAAWVYYSALKKLKMIKAE